MGRGVTCQAAWTCASGRAGERHRDLREDGEHRRFREPGDHRGCRERGDGATPIADQQVDARHRLRRRRPLPVGSLTRTPLYRDRLPAALGRGHGDRARDRGTSRRAHPPAKHRIGPPGAPVETGPSIAMKKTAIEAASRARSGSSCSSGWSTFRRWVAASTIRRIKKPSHSAIPKHAEFLDEEVVLRLRIDVVTFEEFLSACPPKPETEPGRAEPEPERLRGDVFGDLAEIVLVAPPCSWRTHAGAMLV